MRQSPISIRTNDTVVDSERLAPIHMTDYESPSKLQMRLENKGYTAEVEFKGVPSSITGGGLTDIYRAKQFHFHWGKIDKRGSEHAIDRNYFPMEMHIVHYSTNYTNFSEALDKQDGLAVLAFLFEVGSHNIHLDDLVNQLSKVTHKGDHTRLETFSFCYLLPSTLDTYCRYSGSLTTPPCYESVNWFIFYETIEISEQQLNAFRNILQTFENQTKTANISNDFRPTQPLNLRIVSCSKNMRTRGNKKASKGSPTINFGQQQSTPKHLKHP
ncbi:hypothetical protein CHS0354_039962 [Potamilus streckersoni]|uniref:Carbonic anhydrase n=1 Tax=Potamilus streckersoni TaxID=2493646 RepID=A0AAE0T246_9BIVA|nr:hypothetical protein CHS0354_039962 [Potamilus streckersoni]